MDWPGIYAREVAPILAAFAAPAPAAPRVLAVVGTVVGLALLLLVPWPVGLAGLVPLLVVGFGVVMVRHNRHLARTGSCRIRHGRLISKRVEKILTDSTTTGVSEARLVHVLEVEVDDAAELGAAGRGQGLPAGPERLTIDQALFAELEPGDELLAVSLPTGPQHCHLLVQPDGSVRR